MPPKGKQATKGQKQILEENAQTMKFYTYIILGANVIYLAASYLLFWDSFTTFYMFLFGVTTAVYCGTYKFMSSMARASFGPDGSLLDGGIDLNMNEGMAEHMKDLILLTAATQVLSTLSNYFWLLILLAPGRAGYILWVNFIGPWFFAPAPEVDEKKAKKAERKMKRR